MDQKRRPPKEATGEVNLLRDLEVLMEVRPEGEAEGAKKGSGQGKRSVKRDANKMRRVKGKGGSSGGACAGPRPTLKDPELYMALMEECCKEESLCKGEEYVPPPLVINYLVRNDVRPLKKVRRSNH